MQLFFISALPFLLFLLKYATFVAQKILIMPKKDLTYTAAMKELEEIVEHLQSPECEIDQLCDLTRRSVELLKFCREKLTATDEDLAKLLEKLD